MKGIIISKEGATVNDNSDMQYVNSRTPLFKLYKSGGGDRTYNGVNLFSNRDNFIIPHQLGYIPMYFLFMDRTAFTDRKMVFSQDSSPSDGTLLVTCFVDEQNINVTVAARNPTTITGTFSYNYLIYYDKVQT